MQAEGGGKKWNNNSKFEWFVDTYHSPYYWRYIPKFNWWTKFDYNNHMSFSEWALSDYQRNRYPHDNIQNYRRKRFHSNEIQYSEGRGMNFE